MTGTDASPDERFSTVLKRINSNTAEQGLTVKELVALFGPRGHAFLTLFLVLPFMQPIPIPGVSSVLGLLAAIVGYFMMRERPPWVPERLGRVHIEKHFLVHVATKLESLLRRLERVVKPRGERVFARRWFRMTNGFLLFLHGALLTLPLPIPFSNFLPAFVLFLIALGLLEEDLVVVTLGYAATVVNAVFFVAIALAPWIAAHRLDL